MENAVAGNTAEIGNILNIFKGLFGQIEVGEVLILANGFGFLALLLAAILILAKIVRADNSTSTRKLINSFLFTAIGFLIVSTIPTFIPPDGSNTDKTPKPVNLQISKLDTIDSKLEFPLHLVHGSKQPDIMSGPYATELLPGTHTIFVNHSKLIEILNDLEVSLLESNQIVETISNSNTAILNANSKDQINREGG